MRLMPLHADACPLCFLQLLSLPALLLVCLQPVLKTLSAFARNSPLLSGMLLCGAGLALEEVVASIGPGFQSLRMHGVRARRSYSGLRSAEFRLKLAWPCYLHGLSLWTGLGQAKCDHLLLESFSAGPKLLPARFKLGLLPPWIRSSTPSAAVVERS